MADAPRWVDDLEERLAQQLPGLAAHRTMAPSGRIPSDYEAEPEGARKAAVLLGVTGDARLIMIRRAIDGGAHSGQMAFPGGAVEPDDPSLEAAALREAHEEIGLSPGQVRLLGALSPLYIPVSNYTIYPFVGYVPRLPEFRLQPGEVDEVVVVPIADLESNRGQLSSASPGASAGAPCYRAAECEIWGATAMIVEEFLVVFVGSGER
jgi:8-oxo-dGTP pyrophosphatase MutT (NUDIX family)